MTWVIIAVIVVIAVFVIVALASTLLGSGGDSSKGSGKDYKYQKCGTLLTANELNFYKVLSSVAASMGLLAFTKVNLADLIEPQKDLNKSQKQSARNKISQKHADFVLCDKKLNPVLVIELDDSSHKQPKNQQNDLVKNNALKSAGLPIRRVYNANNLEKEIMNVLQPAKAKN